MSSPLNEVNKFLNNHLDCQSSSVNASSNISPRIEMAVADKETRDNPEVIQVVASSPMEVDKDRLNSLLKKGKRSYDSNNDSWGNTRRRGGYQLTRCTQKNIKKGEPSLLASELDNTASNNIGLTARAKSTRTDSVPFIVHIHHLEEDSNNVSFLHPLSLQLSAG